jgi:hypothetical protein
MPDQVAEFLAGTRISFSVQSRKPLEESAGQDLTGMAMKIGNQYGDLLEYRLVGEYVYLRADAQAIEKMTGGSVPSAGELPENADALRHVLNGEWVKVATSDLTQDAVPGQESEAPSAPTTPGEARHKQVMKGLRDVIASEVEFNDAGIRGGTDHVTATAPFRTLLTELMDEIRPLAGDIPPGASLPTDKDLKSAPNQKVTADFSIKAGALTEVSVDLAKLVKNAQDKKLALVLRFGKGGQATAPAGATEVDLAALMQELFGGSEPSFLPGGDTV